MPENVLLFFFNGPATTEIYTLSLHDALPISAQQVLADQALELSHVVGLHHDGALARSEEHTSELQSHSDLVCRLLLEKKKLRSRESRAAEACRGGRTCELQTSSA